MNYNPVTLPLLLRIFLKTLSIFLLQYSIVTLLYPNSLITLSIRHFSLVLFLQKCRFLNYAKPFLLGLNSATEPGF
jgi:hypothetical protein